MVHSGVVLPGPGEDGVGRNRPGRGFPYTGFRLLPTDFPRLPPEIDRGAVGAAQAIDPEPLRGERYDDSRQGGPMRRRILFTTLAVFLLGPGACQDSADTEEAEPDRAALRADSVTMAAAAYDEAAFDTITWESQEARIERGRLVYRISCERCHGQQGRGDGRIAAAADTINPPSFLEEEWALADDLEGLRARVFAGTAEGMPHWGLYGLTYKDVDAVTTYILEVLR